MTTIEFVKATVALGTDGLFFATQMSTKNLIDDKTHDAFVKI